VNVEAGDVKEEGFEEGEVVRLWGVGLKEEVGGQNLKQSNPGVLSLFVSSCVVAGGKGGGRKRV
jgi:hypothetical protein